jgi:hypothetical protein
LFRGREKSERGGYSGQRLQGLEMGRLKDNARGVVVCELAGAFEDKCLSSNIVAHEVMVFVSLTAILSGVCMHYSMS